MRLTQMNHPYKPETLPHTPDLNLKQTRDCSWPHLGALLVQEAIRSGRRESTKRRNGPIRDGVPVRLHAGSSRAIWVPLRELAFSSGRVWADALPLYTPTSCNPGNYQWCKTQFLTWLTQQGLGSKQIHTHKELQPGKQ